MANNLHASVNVSVHVSPMQRYRLQEGFHGIHPFGALFATVASVHRIARRTGGPSRS